jgi:hypothetical protein
MSDGLDGFTGSGQIVTVGTLASGDADAVVSNADSTTAGKVEIATIAETNTGTSQTLAVSPDGLDGFTGSGQIVTVGTLATGDADTIVSNADSATAGKIEVATIAETNTGTSQTLSVSPDGLEGWTGSAQITAIGTLASGDADAAVTMQPEQ